MMERLDVIKARITSIAQLREVVMAMRSLAAMRLQQAADMLVGARRYDDIVAQAVSQVLLLDGAPAVALTPRKRGLVVFSAEHGFVGGYAEALAEAARAAAPDLIWAVGSKGTQSLIELGPTPAWSLPMASHTGGLAETARRVADEVVPHLSAGSVTHVEVIYGRIEVGSRWQVCRQALFPPEMPRAGDGKTSPSPLHHLPPAELLARLMEERLMAELMLAATESLAAENAARLQAMSAAGDNIERKLDELGSLERILRQEQITEELLDVINGAELLYAKPPA